MALLPPRKGNTKRRPGTKGVVQSDIVRGVERTRAWPKKRGKAKSPVTREQNEYFRQAQWAAKYQDARITDNIVQMTAETPLMPRDLMLMMWSGRAFAFAYPNEGIMYSMAAMQDISASLDVISQTPGDYLRRGPQFWEGVSGGGGGGGGSLYTLIEDATISTPVANHDVDIAGYNEILCFIYKVTSSSAGIRRFRLSDDGGTTFYSGASDYEIILGTGVISPLAYMDIVGSSNAGERSGVVHLTNISEAFSPRLIETPTRTDGHTGMFVGSANAVNALRIYNSAGNLTGGRIITLGR